MHAELGAPEVLRIQLAALRACGPFSGKPDAIETQSDDNLAGIAKCFEFAAPANKMVTGPLPRFALMIMKGYPVMLDPAADVRIDAHGFDSDQAEYVVSFTQPGDCIDREPEQFRWVLGRQRDEEHDGCWMTEVVMSI